MRFTDNIVLNKNGKPVAVQISLEEYKKLLSKAEENEEIKVFDRAIQRKHTFISFEQAVKEIKMKRKKNV